MRSAPYPRKSGHVEPLYLDSTSIRKPGKLASEGMYEQVRLGAFCVELEQG